MIKRDLKMHEKENEEEKQVMEETGRNYLTGSILLSRSEDGSSPDKYEVRDVIGEGGATVCYEATRTLKNGFVETGKLKEFYPADFVVGRRARYYSLERLPDGQLIPKAGTIRKFDEMCRDYLNSYRILWEVMRDNPENEILKNYIQHGEILYGCMEGENPDGDCHPTVYVWSPGMPGKGFDIYLDEGKKNPGYKPESRLEDILHVLIELTDCIKALHTAGLLHMDIKPSNFLIQYDSDFEIKSNNISLFDINTLCSVDSDYPSMVGTEGYCAPEVLKGRADNRSDIYSLGAMLFHALVITKDIPDGLYRDFYYPSIGMLVKNSELFLASEINSDPTLMSRICKILEKCLAKSPRKRYQSCSELKADLIKARDRLNKIKYAPAKSSGEGVTDPTIVIQKLLNEHPLYQTAPKDAEEIHALVIGTGKYGQRFIDISLQAGQMSGMKLNITAVSGDAEDEKESYLKFRPAISEFVNINGSMDSCREKAYASVEFRGLSEIVKGAQRFTSQQTNQEIIEQLIGSAESVGKMYNYVFVALGKDTLNRSIADLCAEQLEYSCPVCYVSEKNKREKKVDVSRRLYAVCINQPVDVAAIDKNLGEMAFNTHISWNSKSMLNIDVTEERKKFFTGEEEDDKYNRTSSLAYALSIKYKLHSVEIDCEDPMEAAVRFSREILEQRKSSKEAKEKFDRLVDLEHRRWVLEKAVDGWTAPRDENGKLKLKDCILRGSVKDKVHKTHPCLVNGSAASPLNDPEYEVDHHKKWDEGDIDPALDDLDRMSIELHRCFRQEADRLRKESLYQNADLVFIKNLIPGDCEDAMKAFKQFQYVLKNILIGVESYTLQFDFYLESLKQSLKALDDEVRVRAEERLDIIKHTYFPVIESNLYRNYKANDEVLVEKIPFILTFRYRSSIAMALEDGKYQNGRNEAAFANVAASTVLCPEKITYFYCYGRDSTSDLLIRKLDAIIHYFCKRKVHCGISLVAACLKDVSDKEYDGLQKRLEELERKHPEGSGNAWLASYKICAVDSYEEAESEFAGHLKENPVDLYDGSNQLFPLLTDYAMFIDKIRKMDIPFFEFDWRNKSFTKHHACEDLQFVKDGSFIRIRDMFALMNAADNRFHLPELADDYEALWAIYTGKYIDKISPPHRFENGVRNWNNLCECLKKYEDDQKPLTSIKIISTRPDALKELVYFLPEFTFSTVRTILQKLIENDIVDEDSRLVNYTSDTCRLELKVRAEYEEMLNNVFYKPEVLLPHYGTEVVRFRQGRDEYVEIRYNRLEVTNAKLKCDYEERIPYMYNVLEQLEKAHFISRLRQSPNDKSSVSFAYSSARIKSLLTSAGEILEVYAYYEVLKTGYFDDVATGYEFSWESGGVKNELDLVLIKGFRSMIVECKAVAKLELDYYHKLHSIADQFGIGTIKVLLGNTYVHSSAAIDEINSMQRSRGDQLHIETVFEEDRIKHIGRTLVDLMKAAEALN